MSDISRTYGILTPPRLITIARQLFTRCHLLHYHTACSQIAKMTDKHISDSELVQPNQYCRQSLWKREASSRRPRLFLRRTHAIHRQERTSTTNRRRQEVPDQFTNNKNAKKIELPDGKGVVHVHVTQAISDDNGRINKKWNRPVCYETRLSRGLPCPFCMSKMVSESGTLDKLFFLQ